MQTNGINRDMINYFAQLNVNKEAISTDLEEYNKDIDEAIDEVAKGETFSHEEVVKMSKDW